MSHVIVRDLCRLRIVEQTTGDDNKRAHQLQTAGHRRSNRAAIFNSKSREPAKNMACYGAKLEEDVNVYAKKHGAIVVDLRSDTVTKPSKAMIRAMSEAIVGDDVYGEDPTVNELEVKAASMLGKEAALFVPSGTMGNLIAIMVHCNERGCEAYCGENSHTVLHEQGGAAQVAGVTLCPLPTQDDGSFPLDLLESKLRKDRLHEPTSRLVIVENPINGRVVSLDWLANLARFAEKRKLKLHMDGARLWNAVTALNVQVEDIVGPFDSVTFCLSKGLGAPVGSVLCGSREFVDRARRARKVLGGGMRQVGVLAAAGIVALDETIPMLREDHRRAREMAEALNRVSSNELDIENTIFYIRLYTIETNMVFLRMTGRGQLDATTFVRKLCRLEDPEAPNVVVQALALTNSIVRFVFHRDIDDAMLVAAVRKIIYVLKS